MIAVITAKNFLVFCHPKIFGRISMRCYKAGRQCASWCFLKNFCSLASLAEHRRRCYVIHDENVKLTLENVEFDEDEQLMDPLSVLENQVQSYVDGLRYNGRDSEDESDSDDQEIKNQSQAIQYRNNAVPKSFPSNKMSVRNRLQKLATRKSRKSQELGESSIANTTEPHETQDDGSDFGGFPSDLDDEETVDFQVGTTNKGKKCLWHAGFCYTINRDLYFRCSVVIVEPPPEFSKLSRMRMLLSKEFRMEKSTNTFSSAKT